MAKHHVYGYVVLAVVGVTALLAIASIVPGDITGHATFRSKFTGWLGWQGVTTEGGDVPGDEPPEGGGSGSACSNCELGTYACTDYIRPCDLGDIGTNPGCQPCTVSPCPASNQVINEGPRKVTRCAELSGRGLGLIARIKIRLGISSEAPACVAYDKLVGICPENTVCTGTAPDCVDVDGNIYPVLYNWDEGQSSTTTTGGTNPNPGALPPRGWGGDDSSGGGGVGQQGGGGLPGGSGLPGSVCGYGMQWEPLVTEFCTSKTPGTGWVELPGKECHVKGCENCPCFTCGPGYLADWWSGTCYPANEVAPSDCEGHGYFCIRPSEATSPENKGKIINAPRLPGSAQRYNCYDDPGQAAGEHSGDTIWAGAPYCAQCATGTWNPTTRHCEGGTCTAAQCEYEDQCYEVNTIVAWGSGWSDGCGDLGNGPEIVHCAAGSDQILTSAGVQFCCNDDGIWEADLTDCQS